MQHAEPRSGQLLAEREMAKGSNPDLQPNR
jgi:hypothetical protein